MKKDLKVNIDGTNYDVEVFVYDNEYFELSEYDMQSFSIDIKYRRNPYYKRK